MDFSISGVECLDPVMRESASCYVLLLFAGAWSSYGMHKPPGTEQRAVLLTPAI